MSSLVSSLAELRLAVLFGVEVRNLHCIIKMPRKGVQQLVAELEAISSSESDSDGDVPESFQANVANKARSGVID